MTKILFTKTFWDQNFLCQIFVAIWMTFFLEAKLFRKNSLLPKSIWTKNLFDEIFYQQFLWRNILCTKIFWTKIFILDQNHFCFLNFSASKGSKTAILDIFQQRFLCRFKKNPFFIIWWILEWDIKKVLQGVHL